MPIYEYLAEHPGRSCSDCCSGFEALQRINDVPLDKCPVCGNAVRKVMSKCRVAVVEASEEDLRITRAMRVYETAGMWSHAAELADKHWAKTGDQSLKSRALDNYLKAGYDPSGLAKQDT